MRQFNFAFLFSLLLTASPVLPHASPEAEYHEQLSLRPLPLGALLASFNFRSATPLSAFEARNFRFFPRSLGQILQHAGTHELHLRFSLGRWDAKTWGARPWQGAREGGTGVELWAWLEEDDGNVESRWLMLTNALSGLFCASLNFIDATRTTRPVMSFQPEGRFPGGNATERMHLLHGVLPREVVCTENLTPFLKLLPCKGKAGIATLLDGHKLFDASWQSMAIDVRPACLPGAAECLLEIEQTIDMVLDIERSKRPRGNPIPRPPPGHELQCDTSKLYHSDDVCFPTDISATQEWSLNQIFTKSIKGTCPLADPDIPSVCLHVPDSRGVSLTPGAVEQKPAPGTRCFRLPADADFDMTLTSTDEPPSTAILQPETPPLYAERSFTGYGQERGGVQTMLTNPSPDTEAEFIYMESLPWFMRVYLHTLDARILQADGSSTSRKHLISKLVYRPALDRAWGTQLELRMRVPARSTVFLTYDFEKAILRYTEYPPDANRGFDVAAAVITVLGEGATKSNLRTTSLLLSLPTPDFSMPYNVIIFTSTAIALAFGGLYNILVRRFVAADESFPDEWNVSVLRRRIRDAVVRLLERLPWRKHGKAVGEVDGWKDGEKCEKVTG